MGDIMENDTYRKIDIEIIKDFMDGEEHDIYLLVKKLIFKDIYMTLYEYSFKDLKMDDSLETFIDKTFRAYRKQHKLNDCLKIREGKYHDEFLLNCVASEVYKRFDQAPALKNIIKEDFIPLVIEKERNYLDNILVSEYNIDLLISMLKDKFGSSKTANMSDVIDYIYEISNNVDKKFDSINNYKEYINELINESKMTLHQIGNESLIKKGIYELTMDKLPTKNNLIMISFALRLSDEKRNKLFNLAKEEIKYKSNSNIYNFDMSNKRDKLIMHWLKNIDELDAIAKKKNKYIVEVFNEILSSANYDILK